MPTAVGPNTFGEENLVFGYDLGDIANSYKGEPTENLGDAFPDSSLPSPYIWTYEYSASISSSPIGNHPFSNRKWIKLTKTSSTNGRVLFIGGSRTSGSRYTVSSYVYIDDSNNTSLAYSSDNSGNSIETSEKAYDFNKIGTVQRIHGTWDQQVNSSAVYGLRGGSGNPIGSVIYMTGLQLEEKPNPTQLTETSRSATQGLLDLAGNTSISLNSSTFDSNAQIDLDGTNTSIYPGTISGASALSEVTFETVVRSNANSKNILLTAGNAILVHYGGAGFYLVSSDGTTSGYLGWNSEITGGTGVYEHLVATWDGSVMKLYVNGQKTAYDRNFSGGTSGVLKPFNNTTLGGYFNSTQSNFNGNIDVAKIYNRALTAQEIKANYNAVKSRFNI